MHPERNQNATSTLVLGVGNPLRRDDAAGWRLASRVEALALPGVQVRCVQQLQIEMAEAWCHFDRIVVLDAAVSGEPRLERLPCDAAAPSANSHALTPEAVLTLARTLFGCTPEAWVCAIPAADFGFGFEPSPEVQHALEVALSQLRDLLQPGAQRV